MQNERQVNPQLVMNDTHVCLLAEVQHVQAGRRGCLAIRDSTGHDGLPGINDNRASLPAEVQHVQASRRGRQSV